MMKNTGFFILMIWTAFTLSAGQVSADTGTCATAPGAVTLTAPAGTMPDTPSALTWVPDRCATWYQVYLADNAGNRKFSGWYEIEDNSARNPRVTCAGDICEIPLPETLADGGYHWWVRTWNTHGFGDWSSRGTFTVDRSPPGRILPMAPSGQMNNNRITFSWKKADAATWYRLFIRNAAETYTFGRWYEITDNSDRYPDAVCEENTCSITLAEDLPDDTYTWQVMGWNTHGRGKWSDGVNFTLHTQASAGAALQAFDSEAAMLAYLKKGLNTYADTVMFYKLTGTDAAGEGMNASPGDAGLSEGDRNLVFSTTNIQEAGVDEADIIKTDGQILYVVSSRQDNRFVYEGPVVLDQSYQPDPTPESGHAVRIYALASDPPAAREIAGIPQPNNAVAVDGIYLVTDRGGDLPDMLVTVGGQAKNFWRCWDNPWYWNSGRTEIVLYNVQDPSAPETVTRMTFDGQLIASRRIQNTLHLVTRYTPAVPHFTPFPATAQEKETNTELLESITLDALLPRMSVSGKGSARMVDPATTFLPPVYGEKVPQPSLITVTTIDLNDLSSVKTATIAGPTETIYAATDTLYLASTRSRRPALINVSDTQTAQVETGDSTETLFAETTDIHKFHLAAGGPKYAGSGNVPGHLGWENTKKPYRMSDYQGVLRIATSCGNTWDGSARTRLTLLQEDAGPKEGRLAEVSHIDHIGEPGESLYAVRYAGPRAYMVTFRVTDPLYVFDLSDPAAPKTLGELHIDGYSDYLHPVGDTLLLGIGKDAVPDTGATDFNGRGAWYQGLKLALFDVSDPTYPTEIQSIIIGKRGTSSDLLYDHHALAYLPPLAGRPARLAIPVDLYDTVPGHDWFKPDQPWSSYDWTHTGLYLFEIDTGDTSGDARPGLYPAGTLVVETRHPDQPYPAWHPFTDRAVLRNDSIHYIHNATVWSAAWKEQTVLLPDVSVPE